MQSKVRQVIVYCKDTTDNHIPLIIPKALHNRPSHPLSDSGPLFEKEMCLNRNHGESRNACVISGKFRAW
jgi:hypothetical protein